LAVRQTQLVILPPKGYYLEGAGIRQSFALSPDGERIAFTAKDSSGAFRLFLRDFSELEFRPVADGDGAYSVVWTPDGQSLLFTAKGKLRRIRHPLFFPLLFPLARTAYSSPAIETRA
jgi:Tol biopolymer transport system component